MSPPKIVQLVSLGLVLLLPVATILAQSPPARVKLNEIQVIGTHNSYHLEPSKPVMELIVGFSAKAATSIAYSHKPLEEQLGRLGIRQLEWDLYADPDGGLFAEPAARKIIADGGGDPGPSHDPDGLLKKPGLKIIHSPDFDYLTTSLTFKHALTSLHTWSKAHPDHVPIMVLIELKDSSSSPLGAVPLKFDAEQLDGVDQEIMAVFRKDEILSPDDVRGEAESLREVIHGKGWPLLESVRGKVMFALDNGGSVRDGYVSGHSSLRGRLLFASVDEEDPAAAWFKINDPIGDFDRIQRLVRAGFMVRTRADSNTQQARENDPTQRDKAFASGAQFVSTDYPEPNAEFSQYCVRFDGGIVARPNPVGGPAELGNVDLEKADKPVATQVRLAAYNVLFGIWADPEHIGEMFKPYDLDVIGFSEVPDGDWTTRVGRVLGMEHAYVGKISSANHKDKFKSILSRTPLTNPHEIEMTGHEGWSPASLVGAETEVRGIPILVYSTHIPGRPSAEGSAAEFIAHSVIPKATEKADNVVILGDLNNLPGDATLKLIDAAGMRSMWGDLGVDTTKLSTHQHIESGTESGVIDHIYFTGASKAQAIEGGVIYNAFNPSGADKEMSNYKADWKQYGKPLSDHRPVWAVLKFPPVSESDSEQ
jgi:endonuclease/exonuclease/phosphatase family metal-dependent hydrolase